MKYRIGLDIGITSVGWAILENDERDEPKRIVDLGVRIFEAAEIPKTGEALAAPRRQARTSRRRLRRRKHRLERIRNLMEHKNLVRSSDLEEYYQSKELQDVYELRCRALDEKISNRELAQILLHIAKHRGFKSTRRSELKEGEEGKVLEATRENERLMQQKGYRTVGEMIYKDETFRISAPWSATGYLLAPRNKQDSYKHTILRDSLVEEVKAIFKAQREMGNSAATQEFEEAYLKIFTSQRSFDRGPGDPSPYAGDLIQTMVGTCTFEKAEKRAPKAAYTSERFVLLQKVNNIKLVDEDKSIRNLTSEERQAVIELAYTTKEVKYAAIRKKLKLNEKVLFGALNYGSEKKENVEKAKFISLEYYHLFKKIFIDIDWDNLKEKDRKKLDEIAWILSIYKSDEYRKEHLIIYCLTEEQIDALLELNPSKFQHLSIKAMQKILVYLEQGFRYDQACEKAGYQFQGKTSKEKQRFIKGEILRDVLAEIPNPVVKRSISQTVKVINAIIREYGSPQAVHIELAREMAKNFQERKKQEDAMKKNMEHNEKVKKQIQEYGVKNPTGQDILKFRLWQDQKETCIYTGEKIPVGRLFEKGEYDIDHIVPYSISFDDSYHNKVLVKASANREKGNRLPYEQFGHLENAWNTYKALVESTIKDTRKRIYLLKEGYTEEEKNDFKKRNIEDTKYITRVVLNLIQNNLLMEPFSYRDNTKALHVLAVNGSITAYMRKRWGIEKSRITDKHHAQDAVVIACCTNGMIQKISHYIKGRELKYCKNAKFLDEETGEIIECNKIPRDKWDERFGVKFPHPWSWFKKELDMRMSDNPDYFIEDLRKMGYPYTEKVKPIFVSRMPKHKVTGACHADTIRSARHFEEQHIVLSKTNIQDLKLTKDGEIQDYYAPESDRLLYEALKKRLQIYGGDAAKAFEQPFYKPRSDGNDGPLVKKVKITKKLTIGVELNIDKETGRGRGIAENANGSMIRIDLFQENGKYYFVPIYISDTWKDELPLRAATSGKPYEKWRVMKEENFLFSLYPKDLIYIKKQSGVKLKSSVTGEKIKDEMWAYFSGANISTVSISGIAPDNSYEFESCGIQTKTIIKKYQVDVLGNRYEIKGEKRLRFH